MEAISSYKSCRLLLTGLLMCSGIFLSGSSRGANTTLDLCRQAKLQGNVLYSVSSSKICDDSGLIRQYRIGSGSARISALSVGDQVTFRLFDDKEITVDIIEETIALTGRSFIGRVLGDLSPGSSCVVLQNDNGIVLDVLEWKNNRVFQVVSGKNGVTVREKTPMYRKQRHSQPLRKLILGEGIVPADVDVKIEGNNVTVVTNSSGVEVQTFSQTFPSLKKPIVSDNVVASEAELCTVDILIAYDTPAAQWAEENGGGIKTFAETCVQKMNAALSNTGLNRSNRFRLVDVYEIGGSAGGDLNYAVLYASGDMRGTLNGVSWNGVSERRDEVGADIVCVLIDTGSSIGTTGLGYALEKNSYDIAGCGYNATSIRAVADTHTMTHEVGHNMGAGHSDAMAHESSRGPQYDEYSRGYYFYVDGEGYNTIMGYNFDGYGNYYTQYHTFQVLITITRVFRSVMNCMIILEH